MVVTRYDGGWVGFALRCLTPALLSRLFSGSPDCSFVRSFARSQAEGYSSSSLTARPISMGTNMASDEGGENREKGPLDVKKPNCCSSVEILNNNNWPVYFIDKSTLIYRERERRHRSGERAERRGYRFQSSCFSSERNTSKSGANCSRGERNEYKAHQEGINA